MDLRRSIVTGAAGFIGSHLTDALLSAGEIVIGLDSFTPYYAPALKRQNIAHSLQHRRFRLLTTDLTEMHFDELLRPGDVVFHLAAQPGVRSSWGLGFKEHLFNNVQVTQRLLESAVRCGVSRVVYASSSSIYGDAPVPMIEHGPLRPVSPYGVTKLAGEELCLACWRNFGLPVVPLRLFTVYGPRQRPDMALSRFIAALLSDSPLRVHGNGDQRRDFTYVADAVAAMRAASEYAEAGIPVNVGRGSAASVLEAIRILERLLNRDAQLQFGPAPVGEVHETLADTTRLESLGSPAKVTLEEGLERQVGWHIDQDRPWSYAMPHMSV